MQDMHWGTIRSSSPVIRDSAFTILKSGPGFEELKSWNYVSRRSLV